MKQEIVDAVVGAVGVAIIILIIVVLIALPVMLLWNWVMPDVFGVTAITFKQAFFIALLCRLLFCSTVKEKSK